jgi:acyl-coenzyme A thioesterase PaaI-like protein
MPIEGSHLYDHLGIVSAAVDDASAVTTMPVHDDVRHPGGLRIAALGLAFEHGAAQYAFSKVTAVPVQLDLHQRDRALGVSGVHVTSHVVRLGRTLLVTAGEIGDIADHSRLVAFGSIVWSITGGPIPPGPVRPAPPMGRPGRPDLLTALAVEPLDDGSGCRLQALSDAIAGPGGVLHAGMFQILGEQAALIRVRREGASVHAMVLDASHHFLQAARLGPFVATSILIASNEGQFDVRVTVSDATRVCSLSYFRLSDRMGAQAVGGGET